MDRTAGFGRLAQLEALSMTLSGPGVATALAQELYQPWRDSIFAADGQLRAPPGLCQAHARPTPANRNEHGPKPAGRAA